MEKIAIFIRRIGNCIGNKYLRMVLFAEKMLFTSMGQKIIMRRNEKAKYWQCVEVNWKA